MNRDFAEMLRALSEARADFLIVGSYARAAYGEPRATKDLDLCVRATPDNARRVWTALLAFGASLADLTLGDLATPGTTFQLGVAPYRIDLVTKISGLTFDEAWANRIEADFWGIRCAVIGKADYVKNKRAAGRPQDLVDADHVERSPIV